MTDSPSSDADLSSEDKRARLAALLRRKAARRDRGLPLSHGQESLWVIHRLAPESVAYNLMVAVELGGPLDCEALNRAFAALRNRHPMLRSSFFEEDGRPRRRVEVGGEGGIDVIESEDTAGEDLIRRLHAEADRPFDLEKGPLLRSLLFRCERDRHVLLLIAHHIIVDFWSFDVLLDELVELYDADTSGRTPDLAPLSAGFDDYVRREKRLLAGPEGEQLWDWWKTQLAGEIPSLELPGDHPRPAVQTTRGESYSFDINSDLTRSLRELAGEERATLFALLLASYEILLGRVADREAVVIGCPLAGRSRSEFEPVVGYFVNPAPFVGDLSDDPDFRSVLAAVRDQVLGAVEHQDFPFSQMVERLRTERDPSRSPLFQVAFVWDRPRRRRSGSKVVSNLSVEPFAMGQRGAAFDLMLIVVELEDRLVATFQYNRDLFEERTLARLAEHFTVLLEGIVKDPGSRVSNLPLITPSERRRLLIDWNRTERDTTRRRCLHELFEDQARRTSDQPAVSFKNVHLTYRELNERANRLARRLRDLSVCPDEIVAVCLRRSPDLVIAVLAALKAGGAYVPLEPTTPPARLDFILRDTRARVFISETELLEDFDPGECPVIAMDTEWKTLEGESPENLENTASPENLAYVIYTSGSTGRPKGVMIPHRGVVNYLTWAVREYDVAAGTGAPLHSPIAFDMSVTSLFAPLLCGGRIRIIPEDRKVDAIGASMLSWEDFSFIKLTPAHLVALGQVLEPDQVDGKTRALILGGEALTGEQTAFWRTHAPDTRIVNEYGPTETVVGCCVYEIPPGLPEPGPVLIGRPIANTQLYILDRWKRPTPVGLIGELYIGGDGLARGYLNLPDLTEAAFVPNPLPETPGDRLYRTGDMARYRDDGNIEFLGRRDGQVKIRGYRIEPGEIEYALLAHPGVAETVVMAREDRPGDRRLVAYVVPEAGQEVTVSDLRSFLRRSAPEYTIPSATVFLDSLPLTSNGKVDRRALPAPEIHRSEMEGEYVAPRNDLERSIAAVWREVLGVDRVGIHDGFFDLGGASIQSLAVASRCSEAGIPVEPEHLFRYPTVAELAEHLPEAGKQPETDPQEDRLAPETAPAPNAIPRPSAQVDTDRRNVLIESLGVYLPSRSVSTEEILRGCRNEVAFPLEKMTGIRSRRVVGEGEFSIDLARKATEACLSRSRHTAHEVGLVLCCNISRYDAPQGFCFEPSSAVRLKHTLGLDNALAFDLTNACAGMFTGVAVAESFLRTGAVECVLLVSGEYLSHLSGTAQKEIEGFLDPKLACLTVGDAGAALMLELGAGNDVGFHDLDLYTVGRYSDLCVAKVTDRDHFGAIMVTDSIKQTAVAVRHSVMHARHVLGRRKWPPESFDHILMHQTSETALKNAARAINTAYGREICHDGNTILNLAERGNTADTSHFVAIEDHARSGRIRPGDRVVFGITGSGQTIGTALYTFDDLPDRIRDNTPPKAKPRSAIATRPKAAFRFEPGYRARIASWGIADQASGSSALECVELAESAARKCLAASDYLPGAMDLVLHTGVYRDEFLSEPAVASILAGRLGINEDVASPEEKTSFAFDVLNGSLGFLNACHVASQSIRAGGADTVLVTASEVENNRHAGQGEWRGLAETGTAVVLDRQGAGDVGFGAFCFRDYPEYAGDFTAFSAHAEGRTYVDFRRTLEFEEHLAACIPGVIEELLELEDLSPSRITGVIPPLISESFCSRLAEATQSMGLRVIVPEGLAGDWFTSSFVVGFDHLVKIGVARDGNVVLFVGAGAGLAVGCATYRFPGTSIPIDAGN